MSRAKSTAKQREVQIGDRVKVKACAIGTAENYRGETVTVSDLVGDVVWFRDTKGDPDYEAPLTPDEWSFPRQGAKAVRS